MIGAMGPGSDLGLSGWLRMSVELAGRGTSGMIDSRKSREEDSCYTPSMAKACMNIHNQTTNVSKNDRELYARVVAYASAQQIKAVAVTRLALREFLERVELGGIPG